jgi:hypothetical protein
LKHSLPWGFLRENELVMELELVMDRESPQRCPADEHKVEEKSEKMYADE